MSSFAIARLVLGLARGLRDPEFSSILRLMPLVLAGGTLFLATYKGWPWIDALFLSVMTLLTVGAAMHAPMSSLGTVGPGSPYRHPVMVLPHLTYLMASQAQQGSSFLHTQARFSPVGNL